MKKLARLVLCVAAIAVLFSSYQTCFAAGLDPYMETNRFDTDIEIREDNSYRITETIDVNFVDERHGIYRYIPYEYNITHEENSKSVTRSCISRICDVQVEGGNFSQDIDGGNIVLQIGDKNELVTGNKRYRISYTVRNRDDGTDGFDEFYWNVLPHEWRTPINNSTVTVTFPKETDISGSVFLSGAYGSTDTGKFDVSYGKNKITAKLKSPLDFGEGATLRTQLPDGYFTGEEENPGLMMAMIGIVATAFAAVVFLKLLFGMGKKAVPVVNFYAPQGLTSADVGYVVDGIVDTKDVVSLIIYWADKGYLSITELDDGSMRLDKLCEIPQTVHQYEIIMFDELFASGSSVTTKELSRKFYTSVESAKLGISAHNRSKENRVYKSGSVAAGIGAILISAISVLTFMLISFNIRIVNDLYIIPSVLLPAVYLALLAGLTLMKFKKNAMSKSAYVILSAVIYIAIALDAFAVILVGSSVFRMKTISIAVAAGMFVSAFLSTGMRTYTGYGVRLLGDVLGFRDFIKLAELDRIKALCDENPQYFYNVLPYAYVMGLSDKWAKKFESIAIEPPAWYYSRGDMMMFNTMLFMNSFDRSMDTIRSEMISTPKSSSGGFGGFSGGGFSGGGGGGGGSW